MFALRSAFLFPLSMKKKKPKTAALYCGGKQGGGKEMRENECNGETEKNGFEECHLG
jgi:hypothetical protein